MSFTLSECLDPPASGLKDGDLCEGSAGTKGWTERIPVLRGPWGGIESNWTREEICNIVFHGEDTPVVAALGIASIVHNTQ